MFLELQRLEIKLESYDYLEASCTSYGAPSCNEPDPVHSVFIV
ncbi:MULTISPECIES: hypothetical protein [unclassified Staphylococcus]|nr:MULTISPECIES: hypothetical protein [unclassified Staphylococcus]